MFPKLTFAVSLLFLAAVVESVAQSGYQVVSLAGTGSIGGTVQWAGPMPYPATFLINKDNAICDPDKNGIRDLERLSVGARGGVANTVVFLKDISRGKAMDIPEPRRFLDQKRCRYEPHILLVPQNTALQMKSSDAVLHTVHMDGAATLQLAVSFYQSSSFPLHAVYRIGQPQVQRWACLDERRGSGDSASLLRGDR